MDANTTQVKDKVPGGFSRGFREALPNEKKKKGGWTSGWSGLFRRNKQVAAKKSTSSDDSADDPAKVIGSHSQLPPGTLLHPPRPPSKDRYSPVVLTRDGFLSSPLQSEHSSSTTSLSRKERREAILARAQARRNDESAGGGSSSDEQDSLPRGPSPSLSQQQQRHQRRHHYSQESLTSNGKSRSSRTERYLQRRSRDEECLVTPKYWPPTMSPPPNINGSSTSWGSEIQQRQPEPMSPTNTRLTVGQSPVMLRKPPGSSYNNLGIPTGRAQSALITHGKLSVHPPPPPPRNPLKKSYLLQVTDPGLMQPQNNNNISGRPTSYSFGEVRHNQPYPTRPSQPYSIHDYQNVDQNGRILVDQQRVQHSPGHRRVLLNGSVTTTPVIYSQQSPKPSGLYPVIAKSPSPFRHNDEERPIKPPWISKPIASSSSPAPVRDFWRSKDTIQQQLPKQSARERLAISSPLNEKSTPSSPGGDQHHNRSFVKAGSGPLGVVNGPPTPVTPKRIQNGGIMSSNSSPNLHPVRELSQLRPSNDRHLEQAICELEAIYRSLRLEGDEDLLDRAERRDLPTVHQQLAAAGVVNGNHHNLVCSGSESGGDPLHGPGITSDLDTMMNWSVSGSFESLARPSTPSRVRAPPRRRSALPDKLMDDMAVRRLAASRQQSLPPKDYESGSYLLVTPSIAAAEEQQNNKRKSSSDSSSRCGSSEPDIVLDDVAIRAVRAANLPLKKVLDPQPPFGIPNKLCLGPVPPTSPSDYLHAQVTPEQKELRPLMHPTKYPDLVRDDLAYRNLRKDTGHSHLVNTDKLDDLLKENQNDNPLKKKRAVRSLSANIAQLIRLDAARPSGGGGVVDFTKRKEEEEEEEDRRYIDPNPFDDMRAQSLSDLLAEDVVVLSPNSWNNNNENNNKPAAKTPRAVKHRSGMKRVTKSCEVEHPELITVSRQVHPTTSWVERAQLNDIGSSTETIIPNRRAVPALAQLFPTSSIQSNNRNSRLSAADEMDHLIMDLSEFAASPSRPSSWQDNTLKLPTGSEQETAQVADHEWEESPLFKAQPQFNFSGPPSSMGRRSTSPANSSDSGQVSCCAREVRQILQHQQPASSGRKTSRPEQPPPEVGSSSLDHGVPLKGRRSSTGQQVTQQSSTAATTDRNSTRESSSFKPVVRRMSNNNETSSTAASTAPAATAMEKRAERIARYKEERRKQLQANRQTGAAAAELSSSSEDLLAEEQHSYAKYKHRKQLQKQMQEGDQVPKDETSSQGINSNDTANSNNPVNPAGIKRFIKRESPSEDLTTGQQPVRTNRAARLRAAAASSATPAQQPPSSETGQKAKRSSTTNPVADLLAPPVVAEADSIAVSKEAGNVVVLREKLGAAAFAAAAAATSSSAAVTPSGRTEKDKSTKRKSNLNRAVTDEQIVSASNDQNESQDDAGKRIRRRRTGDLTASPSSAETDMSSMSGVEPTNRRPVSDSPTVRPTGPPTTDLRAGLRKTSHPPSFIRPNERSPLTEKSPSPNPFNVASPSSSSVPWRTGKVAIPGTAKSELIKTEDLTARIEALTAMANQTVAKVDRLTSVTPAKNGTTTNGAHPAASSINSSNGSGSVKAVASKLLNRATESPPKQSSPLPAARRPGKLDVLAVVNSANKLSSPQQEQIPPTVKNRIAAADKALVVRANNTAIGENKPQLDETTSMPLEEGSPAGEITNNGVSSIKSVQGILKKKVEGPSDTVTPIPSVRIRSVPSPSLPPKQEEESNNGNLSVTEDPSLVSILKRRASREEKPETVIQAPATNPTEPVVATSTLEPPQHSILKRPPSRDGSAESSRSLSPDPLNSILKRPTSASPSAVSTPAERGTSPSSGDPRPILKKRSSTEDILNDPRPILKKKSSTDDEHEPVAHNEAGSGKPKPILKSGRRLSSEQLDVDPSAALQGVTLRPPRRPVEFREVNNTPQVGAPEVEPEEQEETRQLTVAERIELHKQNAAAAAAANGRQSVRQSGTDLTGAVPKRRKSFELNQAPSCLLEAVNRHVAPPNTEEESPIKTVVGATLSEEVTVTNTEESSEVEEDAVVSGLERIRSILRRKSSESNTEMKGILRSKSPSGENGSSPPKSILKRHNPEDDQNEEEREKESSRSSSSSEDLVVSAENDLAAKLLSVEKEAKNQIDAKPPVEPPKEIVTVHQEEKQQSQSLASRKEMGTIVLESEESSSGTETTTMVTFRLGGSSGATSTTTTTTAVQKSQTKIKGHKTALMDELNGSSLASRLASLQKNGESEWRKRISKATPPLGSPAEPADEAAGVQNSDNNDIPSSTTTKSGIADRLKVLETAQMGWKLRVSEQDAARFTVAGKMGQPQRPVSVHVLTTDTPNLDKPSSPLLERKIKKAPKPIPIRINKTSETSDSSTGGTPSCDDVKPPFNRSTSEPNGHPVNQAQNGGNIVKVNSRIVSIPRPDDEMLASFFGSSLSTMSISTSTMSSSFSEITTEDFDLIAVSKNLTVEKRSVNVQRRKNNASRNPVKSLILRTDLCTEYEEVDTGVAEREVQRIKLEQLAKGSHLAVEALAGLASKENFAAVSLKSAKKSEADKPSATYLLQIKGRRHVQTRLVEPVPASINSGDCFLLVTPDDVIQWIGRYSNVIERAKCSEVAQRILLKKDLGSGRVGQSQIIEEEKTSNNILFGSSKRFWQALGRTEGGEINPAGPPEEDEIYEDAVVSTNTVWELVNDQLVPCEKHWGTLLQIDMLHPDKVMVFDFGSEMYVWSGKFAPVERRKKAMDLAKDLWNAEYDYTECAINPIFQRVTSAELSKNSQRPTWALLKAAKHHMEPVLFREKFVDWPDTTQLIKVKGQESDEQQKNGSAIINSGGGDTGAITSALTPVDALAMIENKLEDPDLELEGTHLGRGVEYYDQEERRLHKVSTLSVKVWHLMDYEKVPVEEVSHGQFHTRDTYIIRWQYRVTVTGKDLKGQPSVHGLLGRDRFCYFIWHGNQAPPTDQGASALKTVELDEERGPHVRLEQGSEPPAFLSLFQGSMAVHNGKRSESSSSEWRFYIVRGENGKEAHLLEIGRGVRALRSRGSALLINTSTGIVYLWHGAKSLKHTRQTALVAATSLKQNRPPEFGFKPESNVTIKEQLEGAECREFWSGLGHESRVADRSFYLSLAESKLRFDFTPRLFHLTSWSGQFRAEEVAPTTRCPEVPCPYPFLQEVLYKANQPTLFMLDNGEEVWLWQGWWPDLGDSENTITGSSKLRWAAERRCAFETVLDYCRYKQQSDDHPPPPAYLISAGLEPLAFTCLFPEWTIDERVTELNIQEGRSEGEIQSIQEVLDRLNRTTYTLSELQVRPPPEGVDPTRLESYLTAEDFQETIGMSKLDFYALPAWRQSQLRKETGLF